MRGFAAAFLRFLAGSEERRLAKEGGRVAAGRYDIGTDCRRVTRLEIFDAAPAPLVGGGEAADRRGELWTARQASAMTRRHGLSNSLLFAWRKAHGEDRLGEAGVCGSRAGEDRTGSAEEARTGWQAH